MTGAPPTYPRSRKPGVPAAADQQAGTADEADRLAVLRSEDVLKGQRAVEILHAGVRYRLSVTSMGKLILTK